MNQLLAKKSTNQRPHFSISSSVPSLCTLAVFYIFMIFEFVASHTRDARSTKPLCFGLHSLALSGWRKQNAYCHFNCTLATKICHINPSWLMM